MLQQPLFAPHSSWKPLPPDRRPSWNKAKRICIDTEFRDDNLRALGLGVGRRKNAFLCGIGYAVEDGPTDYLPLRHLGGDNLPLEPTLAYVREQAASFEGELVGANLSLDMDVLASEGIVFKKVKWFRDVQIADPCIYELHQHYSLEELAKRYGLPGKSEDGLRNAAREYGIAAKDVKNRIWKLPARFVGEYGSQDCRLPLQILRRQERLIEDQGLWDIYNLESRVLPIVGEMRRLGVRVNVERLGKIEEWAKRKETESLNEIRKLTGISIGVGNTDKKSIVARAFIAVGITPAIGGDGKYCINKEWLATLKHPVVSLFLHAKMMAKLQTTFVASVRNHLADDGRIHCTYNQMRKAKDEEGGTEGEEEGAAFGRLSCVHPNLQQQPARYVFGPAWRSIYEPEPGQQWGALDLAAQEPRMGIEFGCRARNLIGEEAWKSACLARDAYIHDPTTDNHWMMARMIWPGTQDPKQRKAAKEIFLGLSYGMGGAKLCRKLGLPTMWVVFDPDAFGLRHHPDSPRGLEILNTINPDTNYFYTANEVAGPEGQALLDRFDAGMPFVRRLAKACEKRAKETGKIVTIAGRHCHFEKGASGQYMWTFKALNRLIQGSSADQIKLAMIAMHDAGFRILLQVHDEVGLSVNNIEEARQAAKIMAVSCPMQVPSKVDIEMGPNWGASMLSDKMKSEKEVWDEIYR
jgi:DNA polymerase I-like protein with 3'-5' exonuclease and polymerase domains